MFCACKKSQVRAPVQQFHSSGSGSYPAPILKKGGSPLQRKVSWHQEVPEIQDIAGKKILAHESQQREWTLKRLEDKRERITLGHDHSPTHIERVSLVVRKAFVLEAHDDARKTEAELNSLE